MSLNQHFLFFAIFVIFFENPVNAFPEKEFDKRCEKRDRLVDEKDNEPLYTTKIHKNYLDTLFKRIKSKAEDIEFYVDDMENEIFKKDETPMKFPANIESYKQNYDKLDPVDKIVPRLHGFLMVTPDKSSKNTPNQIENLVEPKDDSPNVYELVNALMQKISESCNKHPLPTSQEQLLNVLTRIRRYLSTKEARK